MKHLVFDDIDDDVKSTSPSKKQKKQQFQRQQQQEQPSPSREAEKAPNEADPGQESIPIASTSKERQTLHTNGMSETVQDFLEDEPAIFKKRQQQHNKLTNGHSGTNGAANTTTKSQKRPAPTEDVEDETLLQQTASGVDPKSARTPSVNGKKRDATPTVTSKRIKTFYTDANGKVDEDEEDEAGAARNALQLLAGESKKQARKRIQAERRVKSAALLDARRQLPVFYSAEHVLKEVEENDTVIVLAETGSGKTTRVFARLRY